MWKSKDKDVIVRMEQNLQNLESMLDDKIYRLMIEFAMMKNEIKELWMNLHEIREEREKLNQRRKKG